MGHARRDTHSTRGRRYGEGRAQLDLLRAAFAAETRRHRQGRRDGSDVPGASLSLATGRGLRSSSSGGVAPSTESIAALAKGPKCNQASGFVNSGQSGQKWVLAHQRRSEPPYGTLEPCLTQKLRKRSGRLTSLKAARLFRWSR